MFSERLQAYVPLSDNPMYKSELKLQIALGDEVSSFLELFSHFVRTFGGKLEANINELGAEKTQNFVLDCSNHLDQLQAHKQQFQ